MTAKGRSPPASLGKLPLPRHHVTYLVLRQRLDAMVPEALLPGEHELAADLGVSRMTVRRALDRLEEEGRIRRRRGDGTRAIRPPQRGRGADDTVSQLLRFGRHTTTEVLSLCNAPADAAVAAALRVAAGTTLQRAELRRLLHGTPISHLTAFFPEALGKPGIDREALATRPLLTLTEEVGGKVRDVTQSITAVLADAPLSGILNVEPGTPLLRVSRCFIGRHGPLQFSIAHYRADLVAIETSERQSGSGFRSEARITLSSSDFVEEPGQQEHPRSRRHASDADP